MQYALLEKVKIHYPKLPYPVNIRKLQALFRKAIEAKPFD